MTPYLSVVVPTFRIGGLDILFAGLEQQTFRDFELVLSDELWTHRRTIVWDKRKTVTFPVTHVEPRPNPFPVSSFCKVANTAIEHAKGEVVLFLVDYTYCPPDLLLRHAATHRDGIDGDRYGLMCPHDYLAYPQPDVSWGQDDIEHYEYALNRGALDDYLWSLGPTGDIGQLPPDPVFKGADPKLRHATGPIDPTYFHAKNESVKLEKLLEVNGWDEEYDGGHPYQDSDLAIRLTKDAGVVWRCDPSMVAYIVNPRPWFPFPRRLRTPAENKAIFERKKSEGFPPANPGFVLRDRRAKVVAASA